MARFIKKFMNNTLPIMTILKQRGQATTNLCPRCGLDTETIQHLYQCTHEVIHSSWTASVDTLRKWLEDWNTDPDIEIILADALFIYCRRNKWPATMSKSNSTIRHTLHRLEVYNFRYHSYIPRTYTTNVFHSHQKQKTGPKWSIQLITQI